MIPSPPEGALTEVRMAGDDFLKMEMHSTLCSLKICVGALDGEPSWASLGN